MITEITRGGAPSLGRLLLLHTKRITLAVLNSKFRVVLTRPLARATHVVGTYVPVRPPPGHYWIAKLAWSSIFKPSAAQGIEQHGNSKNGRGCSSRVRTSNLIICMLLIPTDIFPFVLRSAEKGAIHNRTPSAFWFDASQPALLLRF